MADLGMLLREHRLKLGLVQEELASRVGVSQGQVSQWERGKKAPPYGELAKLAEVLDVPLAQLMALGLNLAKPVQRAIVEDRELSRKEQDAMLALYQVFTGRIAEVAKLLRGEWPPDATA
jgi:transcriptional regulator with XRE-family HTH domain